MKNDKSLHLIDGHFNYEEAREILFDIFNSKINFHSKKNWSSRERFGKDDEIAQKRIPDIRKEMEKLETILLEAKAYNKKLLVSSTITISLVEI